MQVRRLATRTALATPLSLGLAACSSGPGAVPGGGATGVISIGISEPQHLVPTDTTDANGGQVLAALVTPLVVFDKSGRPIPAQAQAITTTHRQGWSIPL